MVVRFSETWLNWVDGIPTTLSELAVIVRADDANPRDDVFLGEDDVRISNDENDADDDDDVVTDDVMLLDVMSSGDNCAKL